MRDQCSWAYNIFLLNPNQLLLAVVAGTYDADDFDALLYLEGMPLVEAPGGRPYLTEEAVERALRMLTLTPPVRGTVACSHRPS